MLVNSSPLGDKTLFILLIDGPSGSGKSTLARGLLRVDTLPDAIRTHRSRLHLSARSLRQSAMTLINLDNMYPGWEGLKAASDTIVEDVLTPLRNGRSGTWTRWDWATSRPAETHTVFPTRILIIEGCGAITRDSTPFADCRLWLTTDDSIRKRRALARGGEDLENHWDQWQRQFDQHVARNHPDELADFCIDSNRSVPLKAAREHLTRFHGVPN